MAYHRQDRLYRVNLFPVKSHRAPIERTAKPCVPAVAWTLLSLCLLSPLRAQNPAPQQPPANPPQQQQPAPAQQPPPTTATACEPVREQSRRRRLNSSPPQQQPQPQPQPQPEPSPSRRCKLRRRRPPRRNRRLAGEVIRSITFQGARRVPGDTLRALIVSKARRRSCRGCHPPRLYAAMEYQPVRRYPVSRPRPTRTGGVDVVFIVTERRIIRTINYEGIHTVSVSEILDRFKERQGRPGGGIAVRSE